MRLVTLESADRHLACLCDRCHGKSGSSKDAWQSETVGACRADRWSSSPAIQIAGSARTSVRLSRESRSGPGPHFHRACRRLHIVEDHSQILTLSGRLALHVNEVSRVRDRFEHDHELGAVVAAIGSPSRWPAVRSPSMRDLLRESRSSPVIGEV